MTPQHSEVRGPVVRGTATEAAVVRMANIPHGSEALEDTRFVSFKNIVAPKYRATATLE
jgi:hypothetical protein